MLMNRFRVAYLYTSFETGKTKASSRNVEVPYSEITEEAIAAMEQCLKESHFNPTSVEGTGRVIVTAVRGVSKAVQECRWSADVEDIEVAETHEVTEDELEESAAVAKTKKKVAKKKKKAIS